MPLRFYRQQALGGACTFDCVGFVVIVVRGYSLLEVPVPVFIFLRGSF